ncbi:hypothetical protein [Microcystis sp. M169S2]|nr:hypothetical protein [Microcystis sp. M169S2]
MKSCNYLWFAAKSLLVGLGDSYQLSVISSLRKLPTPHTPHL